MKNGLMLLILIGMTQCNYYDHASEECKMQEFYNYDGVEYERCYR